MPRPDQPQVIVAVDFGPPRPARRSRRWILLAGLGVVAVLAVGVLVTQLLLH